MVYGRPEHTKDSVRRVGSAVEGRCSYGGHRAPTTREASSVAAAAVLHRPSK